MVLVLHCPSDSFRPFYAESLLNANFAEKRLALPGQAKLSSVNPGEVPGPNDRSPSDSNDHDIAKTLSNDFRRSLPDFNEPVKVLGDKLPFFVRGFTIACIP